MSDRILSREAHATPRGHGLAWALTAAIIWAALACPTPMARAQTSAAEPTLVAQEPAAAASAAPPVRASRWESYGILVECNIFSRQRGATPRPPVSEHYMVLRGTLGGEQGHVAFVEDTGTGRTRVCQAGDAIGRARVTAVGVDGLTYELDGVATDASIGDFVGGAQPAGEAPAAAAAPTPLPPTASPAGSAAVELEGLRQRRLQEEAK
jgi:hypothetical protein